MSAGKHRGIRLGRVRLFGRDPVRYRVRYGRDLCLTLIEGLDREWLDAYVEWFKSRGQHNDAANLRSRWLAVRKVRT